MTVHSRREWSDEEVAESFRAEIQTRFEAHNAAFRAREEAELEALLREHPEKRGQPGYEVRDSFAWCTYQASEIRVDLNEVTIVLPRGYALDVHLVSMFDHAAVAWSRPSIGATIVGGEARPTVEILLVDAWDDAADAAWRADRRNGQRHVLAELSAEDVDALCSLIEAHATDPADPLLRIRDGLRLDLEALP